jgi:uncharacterized membrane protein
LNLPDHTPPDFEQTPLSRGEYIAALTHFYRAEMQRATDWRIRLDTTTNWSIISVMGLVSYAMAENERSQLGIVVGMVLVFTFLVIEARRFRFFDIWRSRVRMLEQNFVGPILLRNQISPTKDWANKVADDLIHPRYKLTWHQSLRIRLMRNYLPMFVLLLACWMIKLDGAYQSLNQPELTTFLGQRLKHGELPMWVSMLLVAGLYLYLIGVMVFVKCSTISESDFWDANLKEIRDFDK